MGLAEQKAVRSSTPIDGSAPRRSVSDLANPESCGSVAPPCPGREAVEASTAVAVESLVNRGSRGERWLSPGRFAFGLALMLAASFSDVLFWGRAFVIRDFSLFGLPLAHYYRQSLERGELPLWNPLNNFGLPFLAQWNTMVLYPPCLLYLVCPLPWGVSLFCLAHLLLAGMGMYFLALQWTQHRLGACVAGVAFAFNGLALNCLMWPNNVAALAWMPWLVLLAEKGWRDGRRALLKAAGVGLLQMLTGAPEIIFFTWTLILVFALAEVWKAPGQRLRLIVRTSMMVFLVAGLAAVQLLPFAELLMASQRNQDYSASSVWSMPPWGWANLLVPLFRCWRSAPGTYFQYDQGWTTSYYLGAGVMALAVTGAAGLREQKARLLALLMVLSLVMALGPHGHLLNWLRELAPALDKMRYAIKFIILAAFCVPLLGAFCVRASLQGPKAERAKLSVSRWIVGGAFFVCIAWLMWFAHKYPYKQEQWADAVRSGITSGTWLLVILLSMHVLVHSRLSSFKLIAGLVLILAVWLDSLTHTPRQNPTVPCALYDPGLPQFQRLDPRPKQGKSRALLTLEASYQFYSTLLSDPGKTLLCHRLGLFSNLNLLEDLPKAGGFYSLYLAAEREVYAQVHLSDKSVLPPLADFLGVGQVTTTNSPFEWQSRGSWMPLVTAGQRPIFVDARNSLSTILSPSFQPRRMVGLPLEIQDQVQVTNETKAQILSSECSAHRIEIEVDAEAASMVVIAQSFYRPWHAYVNAQRVPVWRANHAFQAVQVPVGRHPILLVYEDRVFHVGALISGLTLLGCAVSWRRTRMIVAR